MYLDPQHWYEAIYIIFEANYLRHEANYLMYEVHYLRQKDQLHNL